MGMGLVLSLLVSALSVAFGSWLPYIGFLVSIASMAGLYEKRRKRDVSDSRLSSERMRIALDDYVQEVKDRQ